MVMMMEEMVNINGLLMPQLNMPPCELKLRRGSGGIEVWDIVRRKYVALTPEEWVRQHVVHSLNKEMGYPLELIQVEGKIELNGLMKRCDVVVYNKLVRAMLIVECKKREVKLNQHVIDQICRYNTVLKVPYLYVTNGMEHWVMEASEQGLRGREMLPTWEELNT